MLFSKFKQSLHYFVSISFHIAVVLLMALSVHMGSGGGQGSTGSKNAGAAHNVKIIPKTQVVEFRPVLKKPEKGKGIKRLPPVKGHKCQHDQWYGGIGISINLLTNEVLEAHKGYPAERYGIRAGDIVRAEGDITGKPGTYVTVHIETIEGNRLTKVLPREKICIWGEET